MTSARPRFPSSARLSLGALLTASLLLLTACTGSPPVTRSTSTPVPSALPSDAPPLTEDAATLAEAKQEAGIEDCPTSDPAVAAIDGGLPDVTLPCLGGGREVRLAGLRGKPMIINVWASWCGPCRQEAPFLSEVAKINKGNVIMIGIDHSDPSQHDAITFAQFSSWRYPQLADQKRLLRPALQLPNIPVTFFVRADGTVAARHAGAFTSADELRELSVQHLGVTP